MWGASEDIAEIAGEFVWKFLFSDELARQKEFELSTICPQFCGHGWRVIWAPILCRLRSLTPGWLGATVSNHRFRAENGDWEVDWRQSTLNLGRKTTVAGLKKCTKFGKLRKVCMKLTKVDTQLAKNIALSWKNYGHKRF